ncbi:MAG: hypothetical protein PUH24_06870 [Prevotellaceae bacterium]|nr:hypothetical protein [Prevotellaceae bacterium]MDY6131454.1 hypothetical protein [Prevotella sp.]
MEKKVYISPMAKEKVVEMQELLGASGEELGIGEGVGSTDEAQGKSTIWEYMDND